MNLLIKKINNLINKLENYKTTQINFIISFFLICFIRNFLEGFLGYSKTIGTNADIKVTIIQMGALFNLEWITLFLYISLIIYFLTKQNILSVFKILLVFFNIIIIVPIIDYFFYFPYGCRIDYLYTINDYVRALLCFFVPFTDVKVCAGIRIEVFFSVIFIFIYIFLKTKDILKSLAGAFVLYFLAVSSMAFPVFILLVFLPFYLNKFNDFVNLFFFTPSFLDSFLNKFSVMIHLLLIPSLLTIYKIYYGNKKLLFLLKNLFSLNTFIVFSAVFWGFISGYGIHNLFSSVFNIFFIFFLFIISSFVNLYLQGNFKKETNILFIFLLIFSLSISLNNFLIMLVLLIIFFIFIKIKVLIKNNLLNVLIFILLFIVLFVFGYIIIPSGIYINTLNILTAIMFPIIYCYNKKRHGNH